MNHYRITRNTHEWADSLLSSGPLCDSQGIERNVDVLHEAVSSLLSNVYSETVSNIQRSWNPFAYTVARRTLDKAYYFCSKRDDRKSLQQIKFLEEISNSESLNDKNEFDHELYILNEHQSSIYAQDIMRHFNEHLSENGKCNFKKKSNECKVNFQKSIDILNFCLPNISKTTIGSCPVISLIDGKMSSAYINSNPCCFMVNIDTLSKHVELAELILHESLHQKFIDIRLTTSLSLASYEDFDADAVGKIPIPWPNEQNPRYWSAIRALAAMHVYVHLVVFYLSLVNSHKYCRSDQKYNSAFLRLKECFERSNYLRERLKMQDAVIWYGHEGISLYSILAKILEEVITIDFNGMNLYSTAKKWGIK
ncbi:hypothetical protein [Thalassospira alkalitolerans]|uniref:hypothetical protein n=1 Tax=Thalassospira alkalitolerans TaxID=1293890 RepID=UPI003AA7EDE1